MREKEAYDYAEERIRDYKTRCCDSPVYRKGRANTRCKKCDKDVTMEMVLLYEAFLEEYKIKNDAKISEGLHKDRDRI